MTYDNWKLKSDLDDWAAENHEPPASCSRCGAVLCDKAWARWTSDGLSLAVTYLCDACVQADEERQ
jgi:hypothetical protein